MYVDFQLSDFYTLRPYLFSNLKPAPKNLIIF